MPEAVAAYFGPAISTTSVDVIDRLIANAPMKSSAAPACTFSAGITARPISAAADISADAAIIGLRRPPSSTSDIQPETIGAVR